MKILYIDCGMGAAGDMLTAALTELLPDPAAFEEKLNSLSIPGVHYKLEKSIKCGICGTHMSVTVNGEAETTDDASGQPGDSHAHKHAGMHRIRHMIQSLDVSQKVKADAQNVFGLIATAESTVHGIPVKDIHFHEVGTMDAVADVIATCLLMEELRPDKVIVSPIHVGSGRVRCAHGILPVPAPATLNILKEVPIYSSGIKGELCTPTGAALLVYFASCFSSMPMMRVEKIGYGMGTKDFEAANCVRALLGESV